MARKGTPKGRGRIFDDNDVIMIRGYYKMGMNYKEVAEMFYCSFSTIRDVVKGYGAYRRGD